MYYIRVIGTNTYVYEPDWDRLVECTKDKAKLWTKEQALYIVTKDDTLEMEAA